ncbi:uncharacterized protein [Watersipora subatra]|uniref:uncharacterized protein isoform X2 n=1 Tax=Watersipora subatra TaxID=2589382 RepID=UPI00355B569F
MGDIALDKESTWKWDLQLATAKSIQCDVVKQEKELKEKLLSCKRELAKLSTLLPDLCTPIPFPAPSKFIPNGLVFDSDELDDLKNLVLKQKRDIANLQNRILANEQEISELKEIGAKSSKLQNDSELQSLLHSENSLKMECRDLRIQLAQIRQKQWYKPSTHLQYSNRPSTCSPINPVQPSPHINIKNMSQSVKPCSSLSTCSSITRPMEYDVEAPLQSPHKIPRLSSTVAEYASSYNSPMYASQHYELNDEVNPIDHDMEKSPYSEYEESFAEDSTYLTVLPAHGAAVSKPTVSCMNKDESDASIQCLEARKEANNRHFKFFTNF